VISSTQKQIWRGLKAVLLKKKKKRRKIVQGAETQESTVTVIEKDQKNRSSSPQAAENYPISKKKEGGRYKSTLGRWLRGLALVQVYVNITKEYNLEGGRCGETLQRGDRKS